MYIIYVSAEFSEKSVVATATGFVGTLTLEGINEGEPMVVLVTNHHVFQTLEQARSASYQFGYQSSSQKWQPKVIEGKDLIVNNKSLFFTHRYHVRTYVIYTYYVYK